MKGNRIPKRLVAPKPGAPCAPRALLGEAHRRMSLALKSGAERTRESDGESTRSEERETRRGRKGYRERMRGWKERERNMGGGLGGTVCQ